MSEGSETAKDSVRRGRVREERVIALLLAGKSVTEICEEVGITRSTLWRVRKNEQFKKRFQSARDDAFEEAVNVFTRFGDDIRENAGRDLSR